jgi:MFS family permease
VRLISGGIVSVILATYFHEQIAAIFRFSHGGEARFIFLGLFCGGVLGFCGILVTVIGFLLSSIGVDNKSLLPALCFLFGVIIIFFLLFLRSFSVEEHPRLRPGETITI